MRNVQLVHSECRKLKKLTNQLSCRLWASLGLDTRNSDLSYDFCSFWIASMNRLFYYIDGFTCSLFTVNLHKIFFLSFFTINVLHFLLRLHIVSAEMTGDKKTNHWKRDPKSSKKKSERAIVMCECVYVCVSVSLAASKTAAQQQNTHA